MKRPGRTDSNSSKVLAESRTVIPLGQLAPKPNDTNGHAGDATALIDKAPANDTDEPFATFSEWATEADEKAYVSL